MCAYGHAGEAGAEEKREISLTNSPLRLRPLPASRPILTAARASEGTTCLTLVV